MKLNQLIEQREIIAQKIKLLQKERKRLNNAIAQHKSYKRNKLSSK